MTMKVMTVMIAVGADLSATTIVLKPVAAMVLEGDSLANTFALKSVPYTPSVYHEYSKKKKSQAAHVVSCEAGIPTRRNGMI